MGKLSSSTDLENLRKSLLDKRDPKKPCITVCSGTGCHASGCVEVTNAFRDELKKMKLSKKVDVRATGCHGFCEKGPIVVIHPEGIFYQRVRSDYIPSIISNTVLNGNIIEDLLYTDPNTGNKIVFEKDIPFYKRQQRLVLGNNGRIDPTNIEDYIAIRGYSALAKVLNGMSSEQIIDEVKRSGLRGRGGGGFPTGRKWESCRNAPGEPKYIICNADEGDPGAYMDRSILEGNPHSVLEGMIIGAYALGSNEGYVYVRHEYPLAVKNLGIALKQAEEYGLLGENILGSGFDFKVRINRGGGAFVCGESTALMASLEGQPGEPRAKYIHTVEKGLWGKPSNLNNVETWANLPIIINNGADWFSKIGTEGSKGTKVFSLVGNINNTGLVEVPMGITFAQIIYKIGGGIPGGKNLKAIQTGGPSGGCIPKDLIGMPIDFDALTQLGSMMGSGGMIVMDEDTCMVDVAKYFLDFLQGESCGKCVPCREGIERMDEILTDITEGRGTEESLALLQELAEVVKDASLCGLGTTAPNPVLSTIRYFKDEYDAHVKDKRCPAGICKELIEYSIDEENCTGCGRCLKVCPQEAITGKKKEVHILDKEKCIKCGSCYEVCKFDAIIRR